MPAHYPLQCEKTRSSRGFANFARHQMGELVLSTANRDRPMLVSN